MLRRLFAPDDEDATSQENDMNSVLSKISEVSPLDLSAVEILPGAHGCFGYTPTNPIPVNGPIGESVYIFRLRGKTNRPFLYQRLGSMDSQKFSRKLDVYEILSTDGTEWRILYFSMYHVRRSLKYPVGLHFVSWKKHKVPFGIAAKLGAFGTSSGPYEYFPFCLPNLLRLNKNLLQIGPRIPELCAQKIEKLLKNVKLSQRPYNLAELCQQHQLVNCA